MEAFLLLGIPLFSAGFICRKRTAERLSAFFSGLIMSSLLFVVRFFVFFSRNAHVDSFFYNFLRAYLFHIFLPCTICSAVFFFFAKFFAKKIDKSESFAPLMLGFYSLFVPYNVFGAIPVFSASDLFAVPLLFIAFPLIVRALLKCKKIALIPVAVLFSAVPAIAETAGYYSPAISCVIASVYAILAVFLHTFFAEKANAIS